MVCVNNECYLNPLHPRFDDPRNTVPVEQASGQEPAAGTAPPPEPKDPPELARRRPFYRSTEMCQVAGCARRAKQGLKSNDGRFICCTLCPQRRGHDRSCNQAEELRLGLRPGLPPGPAPDVPKVPPKAPPWHNVMPPFQAPETRYNE